MINLFNLKSQEKFFFKLKPENLDPQLTKEVMSLTEIHFNLDHFPFQVKLCVSDRYQLISCLQRDQFKFP